MRTKYFTKSLFKIVIECPTKLYYEEYSIPKELKIIVKELNSEIPRVSPTSVS